MGLFNKLKQGLKKTKDLLRTDVRDLFKAGEILSEDHLERFEKVLIETDMGITAADDIVSDIRARFSGRTVVIDEIWEAWKGKLKELLCDEANTWDVNDPLSPLEFPKESPAVILVAGVNGVGKTTSIAKLAKLIQNQRKSVLLAAGDTFRAAAVEQLTIGQAVRQL